jgi:DNA-binding LacI/PurR family transcriptional regulator
LGFAKRVTIQDVASKAGVSRQTVSRVINGKGEVSGRTRERVLAVIQELGYRPSEIARSLVRHKTNTLGLITADFSDYFFTQVIVGAEAEARRHGYFFLLCSTERNPADEPEYLRLLSERQVDGVLFARPSTEPDSRHLASLIRQGVPCVCTAYRLPGESLIVVDVDNELGGRLATGCLLRAGRRRIGMITGPPHWLSARNRWRGYRAALEEGGLPYDEGIIAFGDWSYESGYAAMKALLEEEPALDGLFAHNDCMAIGAMRALAECGRRVPDDVAVVGFDDIPVAAYCNPPLSTVRQPMRQVGELAARLLIDAVEGRNPERKEVLLEPELIVRQSCSG